MFLLFKVYNFPYEDRINLEPTVSQPNFHSPPPDYPPPPPVLGPKPNLTKISSPRKIFSRDDVIRQTSPPAFLHQNLGSKASSLPPKPIKKPPRAPPPIPSKPSTMPDLVPNLPPLQVNLAPKSDRVLTWHIFWFVFRKVPVRGRWALTIVDIYCLKLLGFQHSR